jgi:uncharacterized protein YlzI (FlbEa/FlbD family)/flagellin-specific chaperone FliS
MIPVRPLADRTVLLNIDSIDRIEEMPETVIVLVGGRRLVVVDLAGDLVRKIRRVRAKVEYRRSQATSGDSPVLDLASVTPPRSDTELPEAAPGVAAPRPVAGDPPISSATNLQTGLIAFDRLLAALARHRWAAGQHIPEAEEIAQQQLKQALGAAHELMSLIDIEHSGGIGSALYEILDSCATQLSNLHPDLRDSSHPGRATNLRRIEVSLSKLRNVWARIAADTSFRKPTSTDPSEPARERSPACSNSPPPAAASRTGPPNRKPSSPPSDVALDPCTTHQRRQHPCNSRLQ